MAKEVMDQAQVLAGPNPKTCSPKFKNMNLQMTHKTFLELQKMMHPTGQKQQLH